MLILCSHYNCFFLDLLLAEVKSFIYCQKQQSSNTDTNFIAVIIINAFNYLKYGKLLKRKQKFWLHGSLNGLNFELDDCKYRYMMEASVGLNKLVLNHYSIESFLLNVFSTVILSVADNVSFSSQYSTTEIQYNTV